ncbi:MAG: hypothetical protein Kow0099_02800 [Candidatus Abyssubacteria bacterium]
MIPVALPFAILVVTFLVLVVVSLVVLLGSDYLLGLIGLKVSEDARQGAPAELAACRVEGYSLPGHLFYHSGHTWVCPQGLDMALVGVDEFAGKLIGRPHFVTSPHVGQRVAQGQKGWTLQRKGRDLDIRIPVDGEVIAVNEKAMQNPELMSMDPYGEGWLAMLRIDRSRQGLSGLLSGAAARDWMARSAAELRSVFSGRLGLVFQDGGVVHEDLAEHVSAEEWDRVVERFFPRVSERRKQGTL